ncbi:unnamed protein product [Discula destructiva]
MPTYLCHGFRWQRRSIVVYIVIQNLDDAAPHWIVKRDSARSLIESFYNLFDFLPACTLPTTSGTRPRNRPYSADDDDNASYHTSRSSRSQTCSHNRSRPQTSDGPSSSEQLHQNGTAAAQQQRPNDPVLLAQAWSPVKLLEEYDPANLDEVSRPHAYIADYVARISDSCSIVDEIQRYESRVRHSTRPPVTGPSSDELLNGKRDTATLGRGAGWLEQLRDELQRNEDIRWYVVVNGDEERAWSAGEAALGTQSRGLVAHQQAYTLQQMVFEDQDRELEAKREQLRKELGYEQNGGDRLVDVRQEPKSKPPSPEPPVPTFSKPVQLVTETVKLSPKSSKPPRTPSRNTFRRLFSRGKADDYMPT